MPTPQPRKNTGDKTPDDQPTQVTQDPAAGQPAAVQMATETPELGGSGAAGGLASLEARVTRLENMTGNRLNTAAGRTQDEIDDEILSRRPNSHSEAVAYEAAEKRRAARSKDDEAGDEGDDTGKGDAKRSPVKLDENK